MAAALSTTNRGKLGGTTLTGTGFANNTNYIVKVTGPHGDIGRIEVTSDGSGGFTASIVPSARGSYTFSVATADPPTATATLTQVFA